MKIEFGKLEINIQVSPSRPAKQTETVPEAPSQREEGSKPQELLRPQPVIPRTQARAREPEPSFETKHLSIGFYPEVAVSIAGNFEPEDSTWSQNAIPENKHSGKGIFYQTLDVAAKPLAEKKLMGNNDFVGLLAGVTENFAMKNSQLMLDSIKEGRTDRSVSALGKSQGGKDGYKSSGRKEGRSRNVGGFGRLFL